MKVEGGDEVPADGDPCVVCDDLVAYRLDRLGVRLHPAHLANTEHGYWLHSSTRVITSRPNPVSRDT